MATFNWIIRLPLMVQMVHTTQSLQMNILILSLYNMAAELILIIIFIYGISYISYCSLNQILVCNLYIYNGIFQYKKARVYVQLKKLIQRKKPLWLCVVSVGG